MSIFDSIYTTDLGAATNRRDSVLAQLGFAVGPDGKLVPMDAGARQRSRLRYGFTTSGEIDTSNPFGQAMLLKQSYDRGKKATTGQLASRGQLYSGYHRTKQARNLEGYQQGENSLRTAYNDENAGLLGQATGVVNDYGSAAAAAYGAWMGRQPPAPVPEAAPTPTAAANPAAALGAGYTYNGGELRYRGGRIKVTERGTFYQRPSDGKWIPIPGSSK